MATRLYPTQIVPDFTAHGPYRAAFGTLGFNGVGFSPVQATYAAKASKTDSGELFNRTLRSNQQGNYDGIVMRWFTDRLDAQAISGTFDMAMQFAQNWENAGVSNSSVVHVKFHIYITVGDSCTVRSTLLSNYVETVNVVPFNAVLSSLTAIQLSGPPALTAQSSLAGDRICIEMLLRVVSSPTPAPTYVPTAFTQINWRGWGATNNLNVPLAADMVAGNTATNLAPWFEFSANLTFQALPAAPPNDTCANAVDFTATIPFTVSDLNTSQSTGPNKEVWYKFTAPTTGKFCILFHGSNYKTDVDIWTGNCAGLVFVPSERKASAYSLHRSQSTVMWDAVAGTEYFIQARNQLGLGETAVNSGGIFGMKAFYRITTPAQGDLYLPSGNIVAFRDGQPINFSSAFQSLQCTGLAIDYSRAPMDDLNGGINTNQRLLVGLHNFEIVEILNLPDLSYGEGQSEVDFISTPWSVPGVDIHPAQLNIFNNVLYAAWFGNGYLYVSGSGTLPAFFNTISNNVNYPALKSLLPTQGDSQPGAPFSDTLHFPTIQIAAPWAIDIRNGVMYYTSGGLYVPVGGDEVRRFNVLTDTQLGVFATPALIGTDNPGLKGLAILPDMGCLVCNGTVVQKFNAAGALTGTFTPSIPLDSTTLVDVALDPDGAHAWVLDLFSTRVYKFRISDLVEVLTFQSYLNSAVVLQIEVFAQPANPLSGIYVLEPGKRNDTVYTDVSASPPTTEDRKIPDPRYKIAYLGE